MPVKGKRIAVTLSWDAYRVLEEFARLVERPVASVAREILEDATRGMAGLLPVLRRAKEGDVGAIKDATAWMLEVVSSAVAEGASTLREVGRDDEAPDD